MKTLIIYGTKSGVTEECANKVAGHLKGEVKVVNLNKEKVKNINEYNTVIIGSPIYAGMVNSKIKQFCLKQKDELLTKKFGIFTCGLSKDDEALVSLSKGIPEEIKNKAQIISHFGGEYRPEKQNFLFRFIIKQITKGKKIEAEIHNDKIKAFCDKINTKEK